MGARQGPEAPERPHGVHVVSGCHCSDQKPVAFSADGTRIATGCEDKKLRVIDVESGAVLREVEQGGPE